MSQIQWDKWRAWFERQQEQEDTESGIPYVECECPPRQVERG